MGILNNDTDVDGDTLIATLVDAPTHGEMTFLPDGSFEYTPEAGFVGIDTFTYRANDDELDSGLATVTIYVGVDTPVVENVAVSGSTWNAGFINSVDAIDAGGGLRKVNICVQPPISTFPNCG